MDWLSEIDEFPAFEMKDSGLDISAKEANQAVSKYEKALKNAQNDSLDIAIIELRKLVVLYPEMGQAALLLGCCQMQEGQLHEALKNFRKAGLADLPVVFAAKLDAYIKLAQNEIEIQLTNPDYKANRPKYPIESAPEIISASSGNWKKMKVASEREKREIMQGSSAPQVKETFVDERMRINWVKIGIAAVCIILALGIGTLLYIYVPKAIAGIRNSEVKTETKLDWLLARLNEQGAKNTDIAQILKEYDGKFYPTLAPTQGASSLEASEAEATPTATPTNPPVETNKIILAAEAITQAEQIGQTDPKGVMALITQATADLQGSDENATAPGLSMNAGEIMAKAALLIKNVVNPACYPYYRDGKNKMDAKAYQEAADLFLKAYEINPNYLDGGNAYNLGKSYAALGQVANANKYFQYVVDTFPGTDVAGWAGARIKPTGTISE